MPANKHTPSSKHWKVLKSELVFDEKWYKLRRDEVELPNGKVMDDYYVSVRPDVVLSFPVTEDGDVIFVRQYKHAAADVFIELPGGVIDDHESNPKEAAKRELLEETGYTSDDVELVAEVIKINVSGSVALCLLALKKLGL